jgi:hypothetical protein
VPEETGRAVFDSDDARLPILAPLEKMAGCLGNEKAADFHIKQTDKRKFSANILICLEGKVFR